MLKNICLSLSTLCQANCVYCPQDRGENLKVRNMPISLVRKITDEVVSQHLDIGWMQLSENGDALMNPDFIKILRLLKERCPETKKMLYTNFSLLNKSKAKIILEESLIDAISCSIDSVDENIFNKINDLNFKTVMKNLRNFIYLRDKLDSPVGVLVRALTLHSYVNSIKNSLGFYPRNISPSDVPLIDEDVDIKVEMEKFLDLNKDGITNSFIFGWNERKKFDNLAGYTTKVTCPMLNRHEDIFIAPDGSCYSCCLDHKCEIIFGNVNKESLVSIFNSRKRLDFWDKLRNQRFFEIGGACKTVICCLNVR